MMTPISMNSPSSYQPNAVANKDSLQDVQKDAAWELNNLFDYIMQFIFGDSDKTHEIKGKIEEFRQLAGLDDSNKSTQPDITQLLLKFKEIEALIDKDYKHLVRVDFGQPVEAGDGKLQWNLQFKIGDAVIADVMTTGTVGEYQGHLVTTAAIDFITNAANSDNQQLKAWGNSFNNKDFYNDLAKITEWTKEAANDQAVQKAITDGLSILFSVGANGENEDHANIMDAFVSTLFPTATTSEASKPDNEVPAARAASKKSAPAAPHESVAVSVAKTAKMAGNNAAECLQSLVTQQKA